MKNINNIDNVEDSNIVDETIINNINNNEVYNLYEFFNKFQVRENIKKSKREYNKRHSSVIIERAKQFLIDNKERYREKIKGYTKKYIQANKERFNEYYKNKRASSPTEREKYNTYSREYYQKRKAMFNKTEEQPIIIVN